MISRLLIVEDDKDMAEIIAASLRENLRDLVGEIRCVPAAAQALTLSENPATRPDVILIDISLPGHLSGGDLCVTLKQKYPEMTRVAWTALSQQTVEPDVRRSFHGWLSKNFTPRKIANFLLASHQLFAPLEALAAALSSAPAPHHG